MYRSIVSAFALSSVLFANAQQYVHQVLVLNEGYFDWNAQQQVVPVTLGAFDPSSGAYDQVAVIAGSRFASDVMVEGQHIYVAADQKLLKYDKDSYDLLEEATIAGIRKIAYWNEMILVTRGELGGLDHYFEVRSAGDLSFIDAVTPADGLIHSAEDMVVADGKAWLGVNNSFEWGNLIGYLAVIDLQSMQLVDQIDLGPNGSNPEKLMVTDGSIYVLNNTDFTGSTMSKIDRQDGSLQFTDHIAYNSGCGASALVEQAGKIYFMEYAVNTLARFDLAVDAVSDTLQNNISAYGLIEDPINEVMYATTTDFFSSGALHVMAFDGTVLNSVPVGVSPGHLALDVRSSTQIRPLGNGTFALFPNPATHIVFFEDFSGEYQVIDALGKPLLKGTSTSYRTGIDISDLASGLYSLRTADGRVVQFMKN